MSEVAIPSGARGIVVFGHRREAPYGLHDQLVARALQYVGIATMLVDLPGHRDVDIEHLAAHYEGAMEWLAGDPRTRELRIGCFGASAAGAAALVAAARRPAQVAAVVSHDGRPDLAMPYLADVRAPALLVVGSADIAALASTCHAYEALDVDRRVEIIPGAADDALAEVARLSVAWFTRYLGAEVHLAAHPAPN